MKSIVPLGNRNGYPHPREVDRQLKASLRNIDAQTTIWNQQLVNYKLQRELAAVEMEQAKVEEDLLASFEEMTMTVLEGTFL